MKGMSKSLFLAYVVLTIIGVVLITCEALVIRKRKRRYGIGEALATMSGYFALIAVQASCGYLIIDAMRLLYAHRLWTIRLHPIGYVIAIFLAVDFIFYWYHRFSHEIRLLWALHGVHHTSNTLNLVASFRLSVASPLLGPPASYLVLALVGFTPESISWMVAVGGFYQFLLHTEMIPKLGWLDTIFNTPSNHRVHHASNAEYLDSNYGGILILFDRLFGTYMAEQDAIACRYGLVHPLESDNPIRFNSFEWHAIAKDLIKAHSWKNRLGFLFGPPGWSHDGSRKTTAQMRRDLVIRESTSAALNSRAASSGQAPREFATV